MSNPETIPVETFSDEEVTQPIPNETLAEISSKWQADIANGISIGDRPTINLRKPKKVE